MPLDAHQLREWERHVAASAASFGQERPARSVRIAVLGWARLSRQAAEGSGLNLNASETAGELVRRGHRVAYLQSGMDYSLRPGMRIELRETWRGVGCFSLVNSPNLAPGNFNFRNVRDQIGAASQADLVVAWARGLRAEVVHVQALEGFGFDTIVALRRAGLPVVVTPHNFYWLCPQVDLLADERTICEDYRGGERCVGCLSHAPDPDSYKAWRRRYQSAERALGPDALGRLKAQVNAARSRVAGLIAGTSGPVGEPQPSPRPQPLPARPSDAAARLLANPTHLVACNDYGRRRLAAVDALHAADRILCPSRFLLSVYRAFGVDERLLCHVPLGQPHFDALRAAAERSPFAEDPPWRPGDRRPLRLAYFGNCHPNKGLATLCAAIEAMPESLAARVHLLVRASGDHEPFRRWMEGRSNVSFLGGYDLRQLLSSPAEYDACIFPNAGLENSPFVVLESLHAGRAVIASDLGGPTDFIRHGENGLLFRCGSPEALVEAIDAVVEGRFMLPSPKGVHERSPLRSFKAYGDELERHLSEAATM
jgi:glycosyltransferase involved in cell wall biosynthesis